MDGFIHWIIKYDWFTDMFQSFWLSDGFVTRYNHSITNQAQNLKIFLIDFLAICYDPIFIYSIKEYFSLFPCLWADKTIRQANSELEEIIECFFYVSTLNCLSLNKIPMIIFSYDD